MTLLILVEQEEPFARMQKGNIFETTTKISLKGEIGSKKGGC